MSESVVTVLFCMGFSTGTIFWSWILWKIFGDN